MLRRILIIFFLLGVALPFYASYNSDKIKNIAYHKTQFENFNLLRLSQSKAIRFTANTLIELDKDFWQARKPQIEEEQYNQKKTVTTADMGIIRQNNDIIELFDNVMSKSTDTNMSELRTDHLIMKKHLESYETKGFTVLKNNNQVLTGNDFIFDKLNNKFTIPNQGKLVYNR